MTVESATSAILRTLRSNGLTVVRIADTQYGSEAQDAAFAIDCAVAICEPEVESGAMWSPAHGGHQ